MNPLSPLTYFRRHKGQAVLLLVLIGSLTLGVHAMVSLTDTVFDSMHHPFHYLTRMSRLLPSEGPEIGWASQTSASGTLDPGMAAQIRAHPDIAAVLPENGLYIGVPMGAVVPAPVLGMTEADLPVVMEACDLRLKDGRAIGPGTPEIVLSEEIVRALDLTIGDSVSYRVNADFYRTIPSELTLVGILESVPSDAGPEVRAGFASYEFLDSNELYQPRATNWILLPRPGSRTTLNEFISDLLAQNAGSSSVHLQTFEDEIASLAQMQRTIGAMFSLVDGLVAVAAAVVVGMVHRIAVTQRLPELGLLHAAGYPRRSLVRRLVVEIAIVACAGWAIGLLFARASSILLNATVFLPRGLSTNLSDLTPLLYTLPTPVVVVAWITVSVRRTLNRMDAVAIIERGKLSIEARRPKQAEKQPTRKPLSSLTFLTRHRRRSLLLLATIGLLVLGVALPGFLTVVQWDSMLPLYLSYATPTSIVSPGLTYRALDPDVIAGIRSHPAVAHAIQAQALPMVVNLPMAGESASITIYAVREQDLPILLDAYGLHLVEGEQVQPGAGHVVLTRALARNRSLGVGSTIGHPIHESDGMPTTLKVVGLLESAGSPLVGRAGYDLPPVPPWAGFASSEYVGGHEGYTGTPTHLLVVPVKGREAEVEAWLEEAVASPRVNVETLGTSYRLWERNTQTAQMVIAISLTILTAVAGVGLAILNHIFVAQRREEFGVLHAVGHSRAALIARTLRESLGIAGAGWLVGAAICIAAMFGAQAALYGPLGTSLDWANLTPWLFTLPLPMAVVAASAGTIAWTITRLDPVAVVERR